MLFATVPQALLALLGKENVSDVFDSAVNGFSEHSPLYLQTQGRAQFDWLPALLVEVIISAILVGVYLGVTTRRSKIGYAPVAVGSAIAALTLVSWFVTNTGMNPARSTAAALFANNWGGDGSGRQLWLFWLAPLVGAALAALFYRAFASVEPEELDELDEEDDERGRRDGRARHGAVRPRGRDHGGAGRGPRRPSPRPEKKADDKA